MADPEGRVSRTSYFAQGSFGSIPRRQQWTLGDENTKTFSPVNRYRWAQNLASALEWGATHKKHISEVVYFLLRFCMSMYNTFTRRRRQAPCLFSRHLVAPLKSQDYCILRMVESGITDELDRNLDADGGVLLIILQTSQ
jgi:hypothetical protein